MGRRSSSRVRADRARSARGGAQTSGGEDSADVGLGSAGAVTWRGRDYVVRAVPGARAAKTYRCPGCDHEIAPGVPHQVVWPDDGLGDADQRRHWHSPCWARRAAAHGRP